jgi:hypothetical protein
MEGDILKTLVHRAISSHEGPRTIFLSTAPLPASTTPVSGHDIAIKFAEQVSTVLDNEELSELAKFLDRKTEYLQTDELQDQVRQRLEKFYTAEQNESGLNQVGLAAPAGPVDAEFGLVLHMQSREESTSNPFWNFFPFLSSSSPGRALGMELRKHTRNAASV